MIPVNAVRLHYILIFTQANTICTTTNHDHATCYDLSCAVSCCASSYPDGKNLAHLETLVILEVPNENHHLSPEQDKKGDVAIALQKGDCLLKGTLLWMLDLII